MKDKPNKQRQLVTLTVAAEHLGVNPMTLRRRIADGTLPGYRIAGSRSVRVDMADVEAMVTVIPTAGTWPR